jgi:hypothetical protein
MAFTRAVGIGLLGWTALLATAVGAAAPVQTGSDPAVSARIFTERVERYARLRARLEEPLPSFDTRRDAWSLLLTRRYLASAIRTARARAAQDHIFAPPVDGFFREAVARAIHHVDIEGLADGGGEGVVDLVVNEPVPDWALQDVPQPLLEQLLPVPTAISYRIVGGALVLWNDHAEIVIDALPDAFVMR